MRLKLRTETGDFIVPTGIVDSTSDLHTLLLLIEDTSNIPIHQINSLLIGYPPKQVKPTVSNKQLTLSEFNIKSGDLVTVRKVPERSTANASPPSKRSSSSEVDLDYTPQGKIGEKLPRRRTPSRSKGSSSPSIVASSVALDAAKAASVFPGQLNVVRFEVPADNTCLFYSLYFLLNGHLHPENARNYRSIVSNKILTNSTGIPDFLGELTLGKSIDEYCAWIQSDDSWGGSIELAILSNHFKICINAVDIKTLRIDRYPADGQYAENTVYVLYDGIHYDALHLQHPENTASSLKYTKFNFRESADDIERTLSFKQRVEEEMVALAQILQTARQYTDTANFNLRCGNCNTGFRSQDEALDHAKSTGHTNFQEIT